MRHPINLPPNNIMYDRPLYIREIQEYLRYLSFYDTGIPEIGVDGIFGPETTEAVRQFQRWFEIEQTGRVDRATWDLLYARYIAALSPDFLPLPSPTRRASAEGSVNRVG